jgi:hypothetical protein
MTDDVRRELRLLKGYALFSTAMFGLLAVSAFRPNAQKSSLVELDVQRINIVEPDGKLRMVISNRPRSIGPIYKGQPFGYAGGTRPGIIFFNDEGSENGGLTLTGSRNANGRYSASSHFAFDQYDQDQVLYLQYSDNNGNRQTGLTVMDRAEQNIHDMVLRRDSINRMPNATARQAALAKLNAPQNGIPLAAQRVYVGRDNGKNALVNLSDRLGRTRLRMVVDSLGRARLDFLDENGRVTYSLPDSLRKR